MGVKMLNEARWRWAAYGAFGGFTLTASDIFLEWRGPTPLAAWAGDGIMYNLSYLGTVIFFPTAIGLALGWWRDNRRRQP